MGGGDWQLFVPNIQSLQFHMKNGVIHCWWQAQAQGEKAGFQTSYQEKDSKQVQRRQRKKWISKQHTQSTWS